MTKPLTWSDLAALCGPLPAGRQLPKTVDQLLADADHDNLGIRARRILDDLDVQLDREEAELNAFFRPDGART